MKNLDIVKIKVKCINNYNNTFFICQVHIVENLNKILFKTLQIDENKHWTTFTQNEIINLEY
jgi:hypothetical protein